MPIFEFPAGSSDRRWLIEEHDHREVRFGPKNTFTATSMPDYGILHSTRAGYRLVRVLPADDKPGWYKWIWANEGVNEDRNNDAKAYLEESASHPSFTRFYTVLRENYAEPTYGVPLKVVVKLTRSAAGSSALADGIHNLAFSGGGGTGAAGKFQTVGGAVVAQWLTNVGQNYTSAPTVTATGVTGASISAFVQPQTAILAHAEAKPADDGLGSIFLNVTHVYETIPGPELVGEYWDFELGQKVQAQNQVVAYGTAETHAVGTISSSVTPIDRVKAKRQTELAVSTAIPGEHSATRDDVWFTVQDEQTDTDIYHITRTVTAGTALPALNSTITVGGAGSAGAGLYIIKRTRKKFTPNEDQWKIEACAKPETYVEFPSVGVRFPGVFKWTNNTIYLTDSPYYPRPGVDYTYLKPRTNTFPVRRTHFFTIGEPETKPKRWTILTPGTASRKVPIAEDTVHEAFVWLADINGTITIVEYFPASDPASYDPKELYTFDVESRPWKGDIWETIVTQASEGKSLSTFEPLKLSTGFSIGPLSGGIESRVDFGETGFFAVNTNAGANEVRLFGYRGPTWTKISGTLPADGGLVDLGESVLNTLEFITGNGTTHSDGVAVYAYGKAGTASVTFTSAPANNDQIRLGFTNGSATYYTVWTFKTTLSEDVLATSTLTLSGNALDGETITIAPAVGVGETYTFRDTLSENIQATGELFMPTNPTAGQVVDIGNDTYTFVAAATVTPYDVEIGATASDSLDNLAAAVMEAAGAGSVYGTGTIANTLATAAHTAVDPTVDTAGDTGFYTSMAMVNGRPAIAYTLGGSVDLMFCRAADPYGIAWQTAQALVTTGTSGYYPSMMMVDGYPAIAYRDNSGSVYFIRAKNENGTVWETPVTVDGSAGSAPAPCSLCIVDGYPAIAYITTAGSDVEYCRATNAQGTAWGTPVAIDTANTVSGSVTLVVVDGNPAVAYRETGTSLLKFCRSTNPTGAAWASPITAEATGDAGDYSSMAIVSGKPAIAYYDNVNDDLKYVRATADDGSAWGTAQSPDGGGVTGQHVSLCVVDGYPAVSYYNSSGGDLYYVRATEETGLAAWATPVAVQTTDNVGEYNSLLVVSGKPAIAYRDATNGDLRFERADNATGTTWGSSPLIATAIATGSSGNSVTTTTNVTDASWTGGTLSGGGAAVAFEVKIGSTASDTIDNLISAILENGTEGTEYSTGTTAHTFVSAAAGAGDTMIASALTGGTAANSCATTAAMKNGSWSAATLTGGLAAVANEIQRGVTGTAATDMVTSSRNLQRAINGSGTAGLHYGTGTVASTILEVTTEVDNAAFTLTTRLAADWESFDSLSGGNFAWIWDSSGTTPWPGADLGSVTDISGAENGPLLGTLTQGTGSDTNHSIVCNKQDYDDPKLVRPNFPPTPDNIISSVVHVGQRDAILLFGGWGRMPIAYQVSVDGSTNWTAGAQTLDDAKDGIIHQVGITDCDWTGSTPAGQRYEYVRFVISPAESPAPNRDYGTGDVSRLYLEVKWTV